MELFKESTENKINILLESAHDLEKGFRKAVDNVGNPRLKSFVREKASEKNGYISELRNTLNKQGMNVTEHDGSVSGSLHRAWIDAMAFFSADNDELMFEEVEIGEKIAITDYNGILDNCELNVSKTGILLKQKRAILSSHDKADYLEAIY